ncbi:type I-E CRISPR-associated protein Cse1/CasA [Actinomadura sp. DC4]|uniref:type I-E CRISPR-associated protein Cse1/CasA n=1 Tax=Actinomadura sp. DC4 TaxID=3055069 RepID=UPI0025B07204|nr:type I-E CRISPR-associated protein Cse1/CasA [Actinomadura sp. DC4]MDN3355836.1 type I-E CRISPR-associated protein Cse1/CasA [Actinomadura sp. DC4]
MAWLYSFDLRERKWIPVRRNGEVERVGLRDLFLHAHEIEDLAVPIPPAASGLWRILYAIAARTTRLDSQTPRVDAWLERRDTVFEAGAFDASEVDAYFERWADRFDLFHPEYPFGQDPRLRHECAKTAGVNKLVFSRPVGQNPVWFGHFTDLDPVPVPTHEAAWNLIAQFYYGAAGRCASRTVNGASAANSNAGPLRGAVSYHLAGCTVFESLLAGLPAPSGPVDAANDVCFWERTGSTDPQGMPPKPGWPGGLLTGRSRHAILLVPGADGETVNDAYLTWAWRGEAWPAEDPYLIHRFSKEGTLFVPAANASRALWRDLDALLRDQPDSRRPAIFNGRNDLPDDLLDALRIRAYGFDQDRQAKDRQWFTATTPPVLKYLEERAPMEAAAMALVHNAAEEVSVRLRVALRTAWRDVISPDSSGPGTRAPDGPWPARAEELYWPQAETVFWRRFHELTSSDDPQRFALSPLPELVSLAITVIDQTIEARERPRFAKAAAHARAIVRRLLNPKEAVA